MAALDDATSLKQKEWMRSEPGEDTPCQYSNIEGHLTPHTPKTEDMKLESTLNITPEGSLTDIPMVVKRETREHVPEGETLGTSSETTYMEFPDTHVKVKYRSPPSEVPKSFQGTKEASKAEVLMSTQQFFAALDQRNVSTREQIIPDVIQERDNIEVPAIPIATTVTTTIPTTTPPTDVEPKSPDSPRISLPEGSPLHPTVIATCRPRTWMQQPTEGQPNELRGEDVSSSESTASVVETLQEEIPNEFGSEWRVLHPFDLPGVRSPSDTMPPNQRRLAENDALVELIQTTFG